MGFARMSRAEYRSRSGTDPLPEYAEALSNFSKVLETERHRAEAWTRRANLYYQRAAYLASRGQEPYDDLAHADEDFTEGVRLSPSAERPTGERGQAKLLVGRLREKSGDVPRAIAAYREALADFGYAVGRNASLESLFRADAQEAKKRLEALDPPNSRKSFHFSRVTSPPTRNRGYPNRGRGERHESDPVRRRVLPADGPLGPGRSQRRPADFDAKIRPFLTSQCLECHGPQKTKGKFRIDQLDPAFATKRRRTAGRRCASR
jgi:tetratricopeptide (TPR) repeat protein